jgi:multidrug efflux pump subunit AcrA (membrane-fusion protein)
MELDVSVPLDPSLRQLVHVGDRVQIQLPEGQTTRGRVTQIGAATTASSGKAATVPVTISLDRPADARGLDQVPVEVQITDTVHRNVLAVPITALVALAGGGYAVAVDAGTTRTLIPVTPGIFNGNLVEVRSPRLQPGMRVEVASS